MSLKINLIDFAGMFKSFISAMFVLSLAIPFTVYSSGAEKADTILYVDSKLVDCHGEMPRKCMLTKQENEADWSLFYRPYRRL